VVFELKFVVELISALEVIDKFELRSVVKGFELTSVN